MLLRFQSLISGEGTTELSMIDEKTPLDNKDNGNLKAASQ